MVADPHRVAQGIHGFCQVSVDRGEQRARPQPPLVITSTSKVTRTGQVLLTERQALLAPGFGRWRCRSQRRHRRLPSWRACPSFCRPTPSRRPMSLAVPIQHRGYVRLARQRRSPSALIRLATLLAPPSRLTPEGRPLSCASHAAPSEPSPSLFAPGFGETRLPAARTARVEITGPTTRRRIPARGCHRPVLGEAPGTAAGWAARLRSPRSNALARRSRRGPYPPRNTQQTGMMSSRPRLRSRPSLRRDPSSQYSITVYSAEVDVVQWVAVETDSRTRTADQVKIQIVAVAFAVALAKTLAKFEAPPKHSSRVQVRPPHHSFFQAHP
jgi:hypothetical protein